MWHRKKGNSLFYKEFPLLFWCKSIFALAKMCIIICFLYVIFNKMFYLKEKFICIFKIILFFICYFIRLICFFKFITNIIKYLKFIIHFFNFFLIFFITVINFLLVILFYILYLNKKVFAYD